MKKTIKEVRDWLLENRVNIYGDLDLAGLDFSDFDGDIYISHMKVKGSLSQGYHEVQGNYYSSGIEVKGYIHFDEPNKMLKTITIEELKEMGYELMEDY